MNREWEGLRLMTDPVTIQTTFPISKAKEAALRISFMPATTYTSGPGYVPTSKHRSIAYDVKPDTLIR